MKPWLCLITIGALLAWISGLGDVVAGVPGSNEDFIFVDMT